MKEELRKKLDIMFVHPPANVSDSNPILDADVAYTEQFVSIPMGFFSMADNLDKEGYKLRILNLGERVLINKDKKLESLIKDFLLEYNPTIIGIDIHWMIHSYGALETARLIKKYSPSMKIVLGGLTASLFAEEILEEYPYIDYVMKGECDRAIVSLVRELKKNEAKLESVPNLVYRANDNSIKTNPVIVPEIEKDLEITRYDLLVDTPTVNPDRALITIFRGCKNNCCYCAGAKNSFYKVMKRREPCLIEPETVVNLIRKNKEKGRDKIYLYGDIRHGGPYYVNKFFSLLEESKISGVHLVFEFFDLATEEYVKMWREWADKNNNTLEATYSPESGNRQVRKQFGKGYSNKKILEHCRLVAQYGLPQSTYFMLGLPGQTKKTVKEALKLAAKIVKIYAKRFKKEELRHEVLPYTFMQIPDAGSELFRNPEKFGFSFSFKGIKGLVETLSQARHWSEAVGYSTDNFKKEDLIKTYYYIQERILKIYKKHGLITDKEFKSKKSNLDKDRKFYQSIKNNPQSKSMMKTIYNLRPYSWIDLLFTGYLAKFSMTKKLVFEITDVYFIISLLLLWFFFNLILEVRHGYSYRAKHSIFLAILSLLGAMIIGLVKNPYSLVPLILSTIFVLIYLQKNRRAFLGSFSTIARGMVQAFYFLFVSLLYTNSVNKETDIIFIIVFLLNMVRALLGDIRDIKHNKLANKKTFPVVFGPKACKISVILLLTLAIFIQIYYYNSFLVTLPLILISVAVTFFKYGYILHQLMIITSMFSYINIITLITGQNLVFTNLVYLGIFLNMIFYPLLDRKSNPKFK